jgi:hypothetical protein
MGGFGGNATLQDILSGGAVSGGTPPFVSSTGGGGGAGGWLSGLESLFNTVALDVAGVWSVINRPGQTSVGVGVPGYGQIQTRGVAGFNVQTIALWFGLGLLVVIFVLLLRK